MRRYVSLLLAALLIVGTGGYIYEASKSLSLVAQTNLYVGLPKAGLAAEVNLGVQFNMGDSSGRAEAAAKARRESLSGSVEDDDEPK